MEPELDREKAIQTVEKLELLKETTRTNLRGAWFPLVLFGLLTLLSAVVLAIWGGPALGPFWSVAGIGGGIVTGAFYRRRELKIGVTDAAAPYLITAAALFVAAFGLGMVGGISGNDTLAFAGPPIAIALAYLVFAYLENQTSLALVSLALLGVGAFFAWKGVDGVSEGIFLTVVFGTVMLITGIAYLTSSLTSTRR